MQNEKNQNKVYAIGFALIALVVLWFLLKPFVPNWKDRQKNQAEQKANEEILKAPSITPENLFKEIQDKSKITVVDISDPADFGRGHIVSSVNSAPEKLDKNFLSSLGADKTADISVANQGGDLANLAALVNRLISQGFVNAKYLRGGIADWRQKGFPLVSSGGAEADGSKVKKITIDGIRKELEGNPDLLQFLDVRGKDTYVAEHIAGAINIPLAELEKRNGEISAVKKVVVYGANEKDSFQAAVSLFDLNFLNIYQLAGGIDEWKSAGGNTASGN